MLQLFYKNKNIKGRDLMNESVKVKKVNEVLVTSSKNLAKY